MSATAARPGRKKPAGAPAPGAAAMHSNPNDPTFVFDGLPLHWQMTRCEKFAFASLLQALEPEVALEIGTYRGGSLQVIARHARKVYAIDTSPECRRTLGPRFPNVEFLTGDSKQLLPGLLEQIKANDEPLGFVLIDGDHTTEGVRHDINAVLRFVPVRPLYIVFHDSFYPPARKGIVTADWHASPYVHFVEVDFVPGVYHYERFDTAAPRSMFGGLSLALMLPEPRQHELRIHQSQRGLFETVLPHSRHSLFGKARARLDRSGAWLARKLHAALARAGIRGAQDEA